MHIETDSSLPLSELNLIEDEAIREELGGISHFIIAQSRVQHTGGRQLALDDTYKSGFPGRIGLVQNGERLVIAIGCRDSHGIMTENACNRVFDALGGENGFTQSFGGGLFTIDSETGDVEIMGTSGDLGSIKSEALKKFASLKLGDFIRENFFNDSK